MKTVLAFFLLIFSALPVYGQCISHEDIKKHLAKKYGEKTILTGVTNSGEFMDFYVSDDGSNWTIVITSPNGCSRMIESGNSLKQSPKAEGTQS